MVDDEPAEPWACRVLIVEDDPGVQQVFLSVLRAEGYDAMGVRDASSMRQALAAGDIAVAVIDVMLPGGDNGLELAREAAGHGCGIIVVTGHHDRYEAVEASGYRYLFKPFRIGALLKLLTGMMDEFNAARDTRDRRSGQ